MKNITLAFFTTYFLYNYYNASNKNLIAFISIVLVMSILFYETDCIINLLKK